MMLKNKNKVCYINIIFNLILRYFSSWSLICTASEFLKPFILFIFIFIMYSWRLGSRARAAWVTIFIDWVENGGRADVMVGVGKPNCSPLVVSLRCYSSPPAKRLIRRRLLLSGGPHPTPSSPPHASIRNQCFFEALGRIS